MECILGMLLSIIQCCFFLHVESGLILIFDREFSIFGDA